MKTIRYFILAALAAVACTTLFAQDVVDIVNPADDFGAFLSQVMAAVQAKDYQIIAALALVLVTFVARSWGKRFIPWLNTDRGGAVLALFLGVAGAFVTSLAARVSFGFQTVLDGLVVGVTAAGGWTVVKKIISPSDKEVTPSAG